jgi:hypothetical protein
VRNLTGQTFGLIRLERMLADDERGERAGVWYACVCTGCGERTEREGCKVAGAAKAARHNPAYTGCWPCSAKRRKPYGPRTPFRDSEIAMLLAAGVSREEVGRRFGLSVSAVRLAASEHRRRVRAAQSEQAKPAEGV